MEALGATASIIAIVTAALHSAKTIRDILSGIKDGPTHVRELEAKTEDLRGLLKQLRNLENRQSGAEFDELRASARRCAVDLHEFGEKLAKLQNVPGDRRWAKVRNGVKSMLREDDFVCMGRKLSHYVDFFTAQLGILGTYVDAGLCDGGSNC
jgi:predicted nuclease with TOPRIM domain